MVQLSPHRPRTPRRTRWSSLSTVAVALLLGTAATGCGTGAGADPFAAGGDPGSETTTATTTSDAATPFERSASPLLPERAGGGVVAPGPDVTIEDGDPIGSTIVVRPTLVAPPDTPTTAPPTSPPTTAPPTSPPPGGGDLATIDDFAYTGAFRISSETFGDSGIDYAVGTLAHHPERPSLYLAGHAHHNAIAEFDIPATLGTGRDLASLPLVSAPRQPFTTVLDRTADGNPDAMDRITGLFVADGRLIVNANRWYDAGANARDTTLAVPADDLDGAVSGYFELDGAALAAGYVSPVPAEWQNTLGGAALTGWASNYSIIGRYSVGPSLYTFDPGAITGAPAGPGGPLGTTAWMSFPHAGGRYLDPDALRVSPGPAPAAWNFLSRAVYGFIIPGTRTFAVVGSNGGLETGIGYKITQDDGNLCGGYCSYGADDQTNYYWLFDLDDIVGADALSDPRPYAHGPWSIPFDDGGQHDVIGATFDPTSGTLYLSLANAAQVGQYDRPPLIVAYRIN